MRGKPYDCEVFAHDWRITPAHAGKTGIKFTFDYMCADHPRACGENVKNGIVNKVLNGSPPRMRGKLQCGQSELGGERITPAHAGKTRLWAVKVRSLTDHPRACGENCFINFIVLNRIGSPPRMRGKLSLETQKGALLRITPAHAGKTLL